MFMFGKACLKQPLKNRQNKGLKTKDSLMMVKMEHSATLLTCIKH